MSKHFELFESALTAYLVAYNAHLMSTHKGLKLTEKDITAFSVTPKTIASKITQMTEESESSSEDEVKTQMVDESEEVAQLGKKKPVIIEEESEADSEAVSDASNDTPKKRSASEVSDASDNSEVPEVEEEDEESDEKPVPKKKAAGKTKPASKKNVKAKPAEGEMVLSDTPKLAVKDRPTLPKGVKFIKGTNYVVFKDKVVAAVSKKGIGKLTKSHTKALDEKGTSYEEWAEDKIKKQFK